MKTILLGALMTAAAMPAAAQTFTVGPQTSTYTGDTRGYYFVAPTAFTITSLYIPNDASTGNQWAEVVRLASAPTIYPTTTNNFTNLGYFADQASTAPISTLISVNAGDIIGILGTRGDNAVSSYGNQPYTSTIDDLPVTIQRLGFQETLNSGPARDLFAEPSSRFYGRINFTYAVAAIGSAVPEPATWGMMILGIGVVGGTMRRRIRASEVRFDARIKRISGAC